MNVKFLFKSAVKSLFISFVISTLFLSISTEAQSFIAEVAAIKGHNISDFNERLDSTTKSLKQLEKDHPNTDIVIISEYTYWDQCYGSDCALEGLVLNKINDKFVVDTQKSDTKYIAPIEELCAMAKKNNMYILAGTVPEKQFPDQSIYTAMPDSVIYNVTLIINRNGDIVDIDRKVNGSDWITPGPMYFPGSFIHVEGDKEYREQAREYTNQSTYVRKVTTLAGDEFTYFPVICAERSDTLMIGTGAGGNADILFETEAEGDMPFTALSQELQNGVKDDWSIKWFQETYYDLYVTKYNTLSANGYVVGTDYGSGNCGIIGYDLNPVDSLHINDFYSYAKVSIKRDDVTAVSKIPLIHTELLNVFPNPASTFINIETPLKGELFLVDVNAREIIRVKRGQNDISSLPQAVYYIVIKKSGEIKASTSFYKSK